MDSESAWIERLLKAWPPLTEGIGPGDDAAVVPPPRPGKQLVLKTDAVVEAIHFRPDDPPRWIGHKALARAVSDFAAMGASPRHALITLGVPERRHPGDLEKLYRGMAALAATCGVSLAGGELTRSPHFWISVSLSGDVRPDRVRTRSGGQPGDVLAVTGRLGGSFPHRHLRFEPRLSEGLWLARQKAVHAMMDLSDGLGKDLPRLAEASGCSFAIRPEDLPRRRVPPERAVNDGEDYELLVAVDAKAFRSLQHRWPFSIPLTTIGNLTNPDLPPDTGGLPFAGWDHFA